MDDCIFCKIIKGEIPSTIVYETDDLIAIKDIDPQAPFHVIIFPKAHIESPARITDDNYEIAGKMVLAAAKIAKQEHLDDGYRIVANCGVVGGQTVQHFHMHMLAKRNMGWPPG